MGNKEERNIGSLGLTSDESVMQQRQVSVWILGCQRSLRLKFGYTNICVLTFSFCYYPFDVVTELAKEGVFGELLYAD